MDRGGIGEIVCRHVNRLDRSDRSRICVGDAFLQAREFCCQSRLIAESRGDPAHETGYFGTRLDETKDIID
jgi:hypothetical protein